MISKNFKSDFRLDGKVAVITGAASGIGFACAQMFAEKGAVVCLLDRNEQAILSAAATIANAEGYVVDICDSDSIQKAKDQIVEKYGGIDILLNSAGVGDIEWAETMAEETWRKVIDVNLTGTFLVSQCFGKQMIARNKGGKIVSIASQAGIVAIDKHVAYSASKAGIISMTQSLGYEWGKYGIQVNAISPTATETPLIKGYWDVEPRHSDTIRNTPAGRFCKPEEIALAAVFLCSDAANMITGANLVVDGGYTIH